MQTKLSKCCRKHRTYSVFCIIVAPSRQWYFAHIDIYVYLYIYILYIYILYSVISSLNDIILQVSRGVCREQSVACRICSWRRSASHRPLTSSRCWSATTQTSPENFARWQHSTSSERAWLKCCRCVATSRLLATAGSFHTVVSYLSFWYLVYCGQSFVTLVQHILPPVPWSFWCRKKWRSFNIWN